MVSDPAALFKKQADSGGIHPPGLKAVWITPLRALSGEIRQSAQRIVNDLGIPFTVGIRTGDTSQSERARQRKKMPDLLITTPESLQLLLASKGYDKAFGKCFADSGR